MVLLLLTKHCEKYAKHQSTMVKEQFWVGDCMVSVFCFGMIQMFHRPNIGKAAHCAVHCENKVKEALNEI